MPGQSGEEAIINTPDVRVRILTLEEGDAIPWHHHTMVTDHTFCLEGEIEVRFQEPKEKVTLTPGKRCEIQPNRIHTIVNPYETPAKYLLIQGVGDYDFVRSE
jgi:quercetin dioxygenase-like cupin family protein